MEKYIIPGRVWETKTNHFRLRKEDMNTLVMDFLVTEGYAEAAENFRLESGTELGMDLATIRDRMTLIKDIQSGNVEAAIEKIKDSNPEILDSDPLLCFHILQQKLIELIRQGKIEEALDFAQKELAPRGEQDKNILEELERTISLMAFTDISTCPVDLRELLDQSQRLKTAKEVNAAILRSQNHEKGAKLDGLVKMLFWVQNQLDEKAVYPPINDTWLTKRGLSSIAP